MKVLVTGAEGFVGKNFRLLMHGREDVQLYCYDVDSPAELLEEALQAADVIVHLAGVNRPKDVEEFSRGNAGFTAEICARLRTLGRSPKIILSSSIQAEQDNPYGASKRAAEEELANYCQDTGASGVIFRFKNLFGKWCRPNYNSVTATFCHNIANDLPIEISDPAKIIELSYIDDVTSALAVEMAGNDSAGCRFAENLPSHSISLGELAAALHGFKAHRKTLLLTDFSDPFMRALYATYLSYLPEDDFAYTLDIKRDNRGSLAEFIKLPQMGQIFVSRTNPGITRGNHYHQTKTEKFFVLQGQGIIRFRKIDGSELLEYMVNGEEYRVVDIPPGYTHSIENVGDGELVTLFWSSQIFDQADTDTFFEIVLKDKS